MIHHLKRKTVKTFKHKDIYKEYIDEFGRFSTAQYAKIFGFSRQNINQRFNKNSLVTKEEQFLLLQYLESLNKTNSYLYKKLSEDNKHINVPVKYSSFEISNNEINTSAEEVDKLSLPVDLLNYFKASKSMTEIIFAEGDSMSPEINNNDMILIDKSKTNMVEGQVYMFIYNNRQMCKMLKFVNDEIIAISKNNKYAPIKIDKSLNFNIVGRVVGTFHSMS